MQFPSGFVTLRSFLIGSLLLVHTRSASAQGLFSITEPKLYSCVGPGHSFKNAKELTSPIARSQLCRREIWLSLSIVGDVNTLKYLQDNECLWLQADIWTDGIRWGSVEIGMRYDDWERNKDGLSSEVQDNGGVFTWSTCLRTIKTDAKKIEVKFFDQQRNTVGPLHYGGSFETIITLN